MLATTPSIYVWRNFAAASMLGALCFLPVSAHAALISEFEQIVPTPTVYTFDLHHNAFADNGNAVTGDVTALLEAVDIVLGDPFGSRSGCELTDFAGFTNGSIALLQRGYCLFSDKVINAALAGAVGVVIFDSDFQLEAFTGALVDPTTIPVISLRRDIGIDLLNLLAEGDVTVRVAVQQQVPEPAMLVLMGGGLLGAALRRRRRLP